MYPSCRLLATLALATIAASLPQASPNLVPDYEVKILMDPTVVLGSDLKLKPAVLSTFDMSSAVTKMNVQFLDKDDKTIYNAGWSPRLRKIEDGLKFELTYKKRYPITGGDIDAALAAANRGGFNAGDASYDAQVEWGFQKQTLSISHQKTATGAGFSGLDLPGTSESRSMFIQSAPSKFDNWLYKHWGTNMLSDARIYGPVLAKRSIGTWNGSKLYIEVWPVKNSLAETGTDYIVEASFKAKSRTTASNKHGELIAYLQGKGWLLAEDSLKTTLIMERY